MPARCIQFTRVYLIEVCACVHIYTAWVSALLIRHYGFFLRPQEADKQLEGIRVLLYMSINPQITVTSPLLPDLQEFSSYLQQIWDSR